MVNLRGLGDIGAQQVYNAEATAQASETDAVKKQKDDLKKKLKNLDSKKVKDTLEKEYNRELNPLEEKMVAEITEEIKNNADNFSS